MDISVSDLAVTPLARKFGQHLTLTPEEFCCLERLQNRGHRIEAHVDFVHEGEEATQCFILLEGWACCYKLLSDGRRQILNFPVPGDFVGLRSLLLPHEDESVASVTSVRLSAISRPEVIEIVDRFPRLGMAMLGVLSQEEAHMAEHVVNLGRRDALERLSHFLLELGERLKSVGLASEQGYSCPLLQHDLADALGLSVVHVNRTLRRLREWDLLTLSRGQLQIRDLPGLTKIARFREGYPRKDRHGG